MVLGSQVVSAARGKLLHSFLPRRSLLAFAALVMLLEKYTIGVGDRFAHQAKAQLQAFIQLAKDGVDAEQVWNKSNREHTFIWN